MELLARARVRLIKERSLKVGVRNLIPKGKGEITQAGKTDRYSSRAYKPSSVSISSDKSYCVGAYIEVLEGEPAGIGLLSYKYSPANWVHKPAHATYDLRKGGKQWLTWSLTAQGGERVEMDVLLIYAGVIGHTQGVTIRISEVILIEGDVAPTGWIPAPEDVAEEAEQRAKSQARIEATRIQRERIAIERDRAYETYRKLRTDSRTPKDKGMALEQVWITANGTYETLYRACNTVISTPSDANLSALEARTREYKTAMVSLQRTIQEVEQAIREDVYNEARGKTRVKVEGKGLDPNKYYPLIIKLKAPYRDVRIYGIRIERPLYDTSLGVPPYVIHSGGYALILEWSVQAQGWGAQRDNRRIYSYGTKFLRVGEPLVSAPNQEGRSSWEYVYLRGGSDVWVEVTGGTDIDIALYPEGAYWEGSPGSQYNYRWEVLDSIASLGEPKIDLDTLKDDLLAEVAKARTSLQSSIDAAKTATTAEYELRVQEVLANVSRLESSLEDATSALQRQIDGQIDRLYGSEIARSGTPPTNLWPASDNAKHEGDTYTCVAPKGVTITASNAHEYPNVGKSWRWTNGGSGTVYGWVIIADTDITQALALASRAQATADGKMSHYTTATPPVVYQRDDQWTLPVAWRGRKDGRPYDYPKGSILTATADSIAGEHHPEHWVELVRYTDLSLEDIKLGGRNLYVGGSESPVLRPNNTGLGTTSTLNEGDLRYSRITPDASKAISVYSHIIPELVEEGVIYSMSVYIRHQHTTPVDVGLKTASGYTRTTISPGQWVLWREEGVRPIPSGRLSLIVYAHTGLAIDLRCLMVERGNKSSDWTPAPEDVQAEIEAKTRELKLKLDEANKAITKAQSAADTAKRQADSAKSAAEANDGKIDEAEARGIAKTVSAYRQSLLTEWEALRSGYEALKTSEYLIDKQPLTTAYSTAKQRYDNLLAKITAILSDSKVSAQEYSQYTAAYAAYQPSAKTLADAIETAGKAIQAELLKRADEAAKGRADAIKVGGRNLALRSGEQPAKEQAGYNIIRGRISQPWTLAGVYSITARVSIMTDNPSPEIWMYPNRGESSIGRAIGTDIVSSNGWVTATYQWVGKVIEQVHLRGDKRDYGLWCGTYNGVNAYRTQVHWVMIEEGNKPSAWQPAPEDLDEEAQRKADEAEARAKAEAERRAAEAEQRAKAEARRAAEEAERRAKEHADNQARAEAEARAKLAQLLQTEHGRISALEYLKAVIAKGKQQAMKVKNGAVQIPLLLNNYIGILDLENKLRAYLSGDIASEVFLAAGLDDNGIPNLELTHLGGARFGQIYVRPDGLVEAKRSASARPYVRFGGEIEMLATLLGYTGQTITWPQSSASNCNRGYPDTVGSSTPGQLEYSRVDTLIAEMVIPSGSDRDVYISGTMTLRALATMQQGTEGYAHASASGSIYLEDLGRGMRHQLYQSMAYMQTHNGQPVGSDYQQQAARTISLSKTIHSIPPGRYALRVAYALSINGYLNSYARGEVHGVSISAVPSRVFSETSFGTNGFSAMFGADKYLHVHSGEEAFVRSRGRWDVPGVLLSGRANLSGTLSNVYNPRPNTRPLSQRNEGGGEVTIRHNIGHTDYTVALTPVYAQGVERRPHMLMVVEQTSTTIRVACWRQWGSSTNAQQCAFDFVFTGIN